MTNVTRPVASALKSAQIDPRDAGAVALAKRYARLIDEAAPAAKYRKSLERLSRAASLYGGEDAEQVAEAFHTVATALAEHTVASDLGPKMLAVLTALGLTPAGRGTQKGGAENGKPVDPAEDELARQRANRATRKNRAAAVDAPAP